MSGDEEHAAQTATDDTGTDPDAELSYEQARDELTAVVRQLEGGGLTLAESLALWERGERLATTCEQWLEGARARLHDAMSADDDEAAQPGAAGRSSGESSDTPF